MAAALADWAAISSAVTFFPASSVALTDGGRSRCSSAVATRAIDANLVLVTQTLDGVSGVNTGVTWLCVMRTVPQQS